MNIRGRQGADFRKNHYDAKGETPYIKVLEQVRAHVLNATNASNNNQMIEDMDKYDLEKQIKDAIVFTKAKCADPSDFDILVNYIYHDMKELSFISREKLFEDPTFEEMNIDSWNAIWIKKSGGFYEKSDYSFLNPEHLDTLLARMVKNANTPFNKGMPYITTDIRESIRLTAYQSPIIDDDVGAVASIRKISSSTVDREILTIKTIQDNMLDFLLKSAKYGISQCYAGETGSGKTTLTGFVIKECAKTMRVFTIEEGAREWDFYLKDNQGETVNSIVHTRTQKNQDKERNIDQNQLLQGALRFDPDLIGVGEMRSDEAFAAIEASNTGHPVITTVHSSSATDSPVRLMTLAKKAFEFRDETLMRMIVDAFPLQVYMRLFPDGSRRVTEIVEILDYKNDELIFQTLFEYVVEDNIKDAEGNVTEIVGSFKKSGDISKKLHQRMLIKGATKEELRPYYSIRAK